MDTSLEGIWRPIRAELDGELAPEMALEKMEMTLRAGRYAVAFGGENRDEGTYLETVVADQTVITLLGTRGTNIGRTIPAIVQLRGDRLRICFGLDGTVPTEFATTGGARRYLVTYRRLSS